MTRREALAGGVRRLLEAHVPDAEIDASLLLRFAAGLSRTDLLFDGGLELPEEELAIYEKLVSRRAEHIPLQYLTGTQAFMGMEFRVTEDVLIPRQDTERLTEEVLRCCGGKRVLDVCTGSGCIIISLAKLGDVREAEGCDLSEQALAVARANAAALDADVNFFSSDLLSGARGRYDIIVSNPPYIPSSEIAALMPEVRIHEPRMALDGGEDGLCFYRRLIGQAGEFLVPGGRLFLEIGCTQAEAVSKLLLAGGFREIRVVKDYAGLDRVVAGVIGTEREK